VADGLLFSELRPVSAGRPDLLLLAVLMMTMPTANMHPAHSIQRRTAHKTVLRTASQARGHFRKLFIYCQEVSATLRQLSSGGSGRGCTPV
jgi:hypothetical protein